MFTLKKVDFWKPPEEAPPKAASPYPVKPLKEVMHAKAVKNRKWHKNDKVAADIAEGADLEKLLPKLEITYPAIDSLKPAKRRVRKSNQQHINMLMGSMTRSGFVVPILTAQDRIFDGHSRWEAAKLLNLKTVPRIEIDHLDENDRRMLTIMVNASAENGEWCPENTRLELLDLQGLGYDLADTGLSIEQLDVLTLDEPGNEAAERVPEPPVKPVTIVGDKWILGYHMIVCGSALEDASYQSLLGDGTVQAVFTDPPYGVAIAGNVSGLGKVKHQDFVMGCAEMTKPQLQDFLSTSCTLAASRLDPGRVMFKCMDWRHIDMLYAAGEAAKLDLVNCVVWSKQAGMGSFYRSAHEFIAVFCKGKTPKVNNVKLGKHGRDRSNVWEYASANQPGSSAAKMLKSHPTVKPSEMVRDAILDCTVRGEAVLDPFLGSGTTIIAAEMAGRIGYGIELDPKYVDVAVRRWEEFTGKQATHSETGKTFAEMAKERGVS